MPEEGVGIGRPVRGVDGTAEDGGVGDEVRVFRDVGAEPRVADQQGDGRGVHRGTYITETLGDRQLVRRDAVRPKGEHRGDDVLVDGFKEVRRGQVTGQVEAVTQEDAEEVAFRRDIVRRSHGRKEGFGGLRAWVPCVKMLSVVRSAPWSSAVPW